MGVVTISAAFGAGGSEIGPAVGDALGLPFFDRAIPVEVAGQMGVPVSDVEQREERHEGRFWRVLTSMAIVPDPTGACTMGAGGLGDEREFRDQTERVLRRIAADTGGVILGRAAAIVLADLTDALHVRLHGPLEARAADRARRAGIEIGRARTELRQNDQAREGYVRHLYRKDPTEARHYHLTIDTMALPWDVATELIVRAAGERGVAAG